MEKSILVSVIAVIAVLALISVVSAGELTSSWDVTVNGAEVSPDGSTISGIEAGETIPIKIVFTAEKNASDVVVKAFIDGYRSEISDKTGRFELVEGSIYTRYLSLNLPSDVDPTEDYNLMIRISDKTESDEQEYSLKLQRESYNLNVLSVEVPKEATAGSVIAVDVVLKNWGMHDLEDVFVKVKIPDFGIERKVYFGDIDPLDESEYDDYKEADREDAVERRIYLTIPENAKTGVYVLEAEAYNVDSSATTKTNIIISGAEEASSVLTGTAVRTLSIGEEVTYDVIIVNSGSKMKVYTLTPEEAKGLIVEVEPVVTVSADSSKTAQVKVKATDSAEEGTHVVKINVESEGKLVKQVSLSANVEKGTVIAKANSIVILTVILVIVFVVLLIVLIVLLTRKPAATETEETSYY